MKNLGLLTIIFLTLVFNSIAQNDVPLTISPMKVAFIRTSDFFDEQKGIVALVNANKQLKKEFAAKESEVEVLKNKSLAVSKAKGEWIRFTPGTLQELQVKEAEEAVAIKEYETAKANAEKAYQKRQTELFQPFQQAVKTALEEFSKKNGLNLLIDISEVKQGIGGSIDANTVDVTAVFIKDYNSFVLNKPRTYSQINVPAHKAVFIDMPSLYDEKTGVAKLVAAQNQLNREFQFRGTELQTLSTKCGSMDRDFQDKNSRGLLVPADVQKQKSEIEKCWNSLQFKQSESQNAYQRRRNELAGPIEREIVSALPTFYQKHGVQLTLDEGILQNVILYRSELTVQNVAAAFAKEFNSKNPLQ